MTAAVIDGKAAAQRLRDRVGAEVARLQSEHKLQPGLAVVLVGEDPASQVYVRNKGKQTVEAGMLSQEHKLDDSVTEKDLLDLVQQLNADPTVHGILVQLPLPDHIDEQRVLQAIDPAKDVDGFHPVNVGGLATGDPAAFAPCTPGGCLIMLREQFDGNLSGRRSLRERRTISSLRRSTALRFMAEACSMYLITR